VLVKIQSDPRVYALGENTDDVFAPALRWIESEETAIDSYGNDWADYVIDVEPTFFPHFTHGTSISNPGDIQVDRSIMKTREQLAWLAVK